MTLSQTFTSFATSPLTRSLRAFCSQITVRSVAMAHQDIQVPHRELFIGGTWTKSAKGNRLDIVTPIDGSVVGSIPAGSKEDIEKAIAAAKAAHKSGIWGKKPGSQRAAILKAIAEEVKARKTELARYETLDNGKPIIESEADMDEVAGTFEYYAGLAEKLEREGDLDLNVPDDTLKIVLRKEPLGVCGLITPFNYPLLMAVWKIAPALAAGNTIVLKPSEMTSVTCLELGALAVKAGLPAGVLNVVTGNGPEAGAPLSQSKEVAKISFTGSVATGRRIGLCAVENLKPTTLELGGKSPLVIFDDADIEKAVEWTMFGIVWTSGQICSATSRLLIQEGLADKFYAQLKKRMEEIKVGNPLEEDTRLGPVVSESQFNKVLGFIERAKKEGAKVLTGGGKHPGFSKGFYIQPTVFTDVSLDSEIWCQEVFGPVLAARTFKTEEEAIQIANDTEYGLAAAVISKDMARCARFAEAFETGIVWINNTQFSHISAPWGGVKNSGYGRDCGEASLDHYLNLKQIVTYVSDEKLDWFPSKL